MIEELKKLFENYITAKDTYNALIDEFNENEGSAGVIRDELSKEQEERRQCVKGDLNKASSLVLGHPLSFNHIRCWMVDVHGQEKCNTDRPDTPADDWEDSFCSEVDKSLIEEVVADAQGDRSHKYIAHGGGLAVEVRKVMAKYHLTDSGMGGCCWHLGCHCTEVEARDLILELYVKFRKALDSGLIYIDRHSWSIEWKQQG